MAWKKFIVGDYVFFDRGINKHYPAHNEHRGEILSIEILPKIRSAGTVVVYEMACECGSILHPRADHIFLSTSFYFIDH